jgi:hypothetical protein
MRELSHNKSSTSKGSTSANIKKLKMMLLLMQMNMAMDVNQAVGRLSLPKFFLIFSLLFSTVSHATTAHF